MAWFTYDVLQNSSNIKNNTSTIWEAVMLVLLMEMIYEMCCWDGLRWHDIYTDFHDDQFSHSHTIKVITTTISKAAVLVIASTSDGKMEPYYKPKIPEIWLCLTASITWCALVNNFQFWNVQYGRLWHLFHLNTIPRHSFLYIFHTRLILHNTKQTGITPQKNHCCFTNMSLTKDWEALH
jgi:hypothetical protein